MNPLYTRKLKSALIEIGKEVESIEETPELASLELAFENLKCAMKVNDMQDMRRYCRRLSAKIIKLMVDKL